MSNQWAPPPPPKPRRKWPRRLAWSGAGFFVVVVLLYFVATSAFFLKHFILPKVSKAVHAQITVADAGIHPFSGVSLKNVKVRTSALEEPLFTAAEISARYSLWDIIGGNIHVDRIRLVAPEISIVQYADGTSNLDPLLASSETPPPPAKPEKPPAASGPLRVELGDFLLTNANLRLVHHHVGGGRDEVQVNNLHVALANLANGKAASLNFGVGARLDRTPKTETPPKPTETFQAALGGSLTCWLTRQLQPETIQGQVALDILQAPPAFADLAGLRAQLDTDFGPNGITQILLSFLQKEVALGRVRLSGPFNILQREGRVRLEVSGIDRRVLNLAGAAFGVDFGRTTIQGTNDFELTQSGNVVALDGGIRAGQLGISMHGKTTVPIDLNIGYQLRLDQPAQSAEIKAFTIEGLAAQKPLLSASLVRPMKFVWAQPAAAVEDSALSLVLTNLDLADWKAFVGDFQGRLHAGLLLQSQGAGKNLDLNFNASISGWSAQLGPAKLDQVQIDLALQSRLKDFSAAFLDRLNVEVSRLKTKSASVLVQGRYDLKTQDADANATVEANLPAIAGMLGMPELKLSSGAIQLQSTVRQTNTFPGQTNRSGLVQSVAGNLRLQDLTGSYGSFVFDRFRSGLDFDLGMKNQQAELRRVHLGLEHAGQAGGAVDLSGQFHLTNQNGRATLKVADLNQHVLRSVLTTPHGNPLLDSVSINLDTEAVYDPKNATTLQTLLKVSNVRFPPSQAGTSAPPLSVEFRLDAGLEKSKALLKQLSGSFLSGDQSGGRLSVSGQYDLSNQTGLATFRLEDLNQHLLAPVVAGALGNKSLSQASISVNVNARYDAKTESALDGDLKLGPFLVLDPSGQWPNKPWAVALKVGAGLRGDDASLRLTDGAIQIDQQACGAFAVQGSYHLKTGAGQGNVELTGLNQRLLGPMLAPSLGKKELVSANFGLALSASHVPAGASRVKGRVNLGDLVLRDPQQKTPMKPLALGLTIDGGLTGKTINLDQLLLNLSPTTRAKNELNLSGTVDMSAPQAMAGKIKLQAESLDFTPYYDLFMAMPPATNQVETASSKDAEAIEKVPPRPPRTPPSMEEPAPVTLPFKQFLVEGKIDRLYLREIALSGWQLGLILDTNRIRLDPFQFDLNGGPFHCGADVDLSRPGYVYDVKLNALNLPLEPVVNTFAPEARGQVQGGLIAVAQVKGAGVTGPNLRTNLQGQIDFSVTNAVIKITERRVKAFLIPIAVMLAAPDLLKSPLTWAGALVKLGGGKINLAHAGAASPLFVLGAQGETPIADDVLQSPLNQWPVSLFLERNLAKRIRMVPRGTPEDATFVRLPEFIQAIGVLGEPEAKLNKLALTGSVLKQLADPGAGEAKPKSPSPLDLLRK